MGERRGNKRRHLIYYLPVFDYKTNKVMGHLVDITVKGLMLMSERPLKTDTIFHLKMFLPGKNELSFKAKSVWAKKDINPDFYDTGFELQDISPDTVKVIERLIAKLGFND